jgi:hypothetical protein
LTLLYLTASDSINGPQEAAQRTCLFTSTSRFWLFITSAGDSLNFDESLSSHDRWTSFSRPGGKTQIWRISGVIEATPPVDWGPFNSAARTVITRHPISMDVIEEKW